MVRLHKRTVLLFWAPIVPDHLEPALALKWTDHENHASRRSIANPSVSR